MQEPSPSLSGYRFGVFEVDLRAGEIRKNGLKIKLQEQPFQVLTFLLQNSPNLVAREELRKRLWDEHTFVEFDHGLNNAIGRIREALGDSADNARFIETVPKRGYRLIVPVEAIMAAQVLRGRVNGSRTNGVQSEVPPLDADRPSANSDHIKTTALTRRIWPWVGNEEILHRTGEAEAVQARKNRMRRWQRPLAALLAIAAVALLIAFLLRTIRPANHAITRFVVAIPPSDQLIFYGGVALSPDSSRLVYVAASHAGIGQLYLRSISRFEATPIPGTEGAYNPFFSPDGQSVGFAAKGELKKVSLSGGAPLTLCSVTGLRGATWAPDGTIIFAPSTGSGLYRVSADGGTPNPLTFPDRRKGAVSHRWPEILPGGKELLFTSWAGTERRVNLLSLESGDQRVLVEGGTYPQYLSPGYIVYARDGGMQAVPFDSKRLTVTGAPISVLEGVDMNPVNGQVSVSASADGSLAYIPGVSGREKRTMLWVDRKGVSHTIAAPARGFRSIRLSPDGQRLAAGITDADPGLWIYELDRGTLTRLSTSVLNPYAVWTPDGKRITFRSAISNPFNLDWMPIDGSGVEDHLITGEGLPVPGSWSPDGQVLVFSEQSPATGWDIWVLNRDDDHKPRPFLQTASNEAGATFSPDGRWIAYQSDETGRDEIYVASFPVAGTKWQISTEGGAEPLWANNGRELFFRNGEEMMAATVETKPTFAAGKAKLLFKGDYAAGPLGFWPNYGVTPDSQRFLMLRAAESERYASQINVVLNWSEELKEKVSATKR
ncbi:MAG TPA: winged helix-turn-helix domain-containing protein [Candidatus Acidoferrales bacterium]|nr:winged helix-turn-helix domain-containing protein [Candidatus Acidoferrales bacterium]